MDELREYLEAEFAKMGKRLLDSMDQRIDEVRGEMRELRGEMRELREEVRGDIHGLREEVGGDVHGLRGEMSELRDETRGGIRQTHVLIEQARDEIRTVAEGVASNTERIERLREEGHQERQEIRNELIGHLRSSHQSLDRRVNRLEEIVGDSPRRMPRL